MNPRFAYSTHGTMALAAAALEEYFATGEVLEAEHPTIVRRVLRTPAPFPRAQSVRYCIEIDG
jgi:hypothetical protein